MRHLLLTVMCLLPFIGVTRADAEVSLYGGTSCYRPPGSPHCLALYAGKSGRFDLVKTGAGDGVAYGSGVTQNKVHYYTFANALIDGRRPMFAEAELSDTVLAPGAELSLTFYKEATDKINYILISGDVSGTVKYSAYSGYDTQVNLTLTVGDPKVSASGDAGAAVGIVIDYSDNAEMDFNGAVFVTNAHPLDIGPSASESDRILTPFKVRKLLERESAAGRPANVSIKGLQNSALDLAGYLPESLLSAFGIDASDSAAVLSQLAAYRGNKPAPAVPVANTGIIESADFQFNVPLNASSRIVRVEMSNADWSSEVVGFGRSDRTQNAAPDIRSGLQSLKSLKGKATDSKEGLETLAELSASLSIVADNDSALSKKERKVLKTTASLLTKALGKAEAVRGSVGKRKAKLSAELATLKKNTKELLKSIERLFAS